MKKNNSSNKNVHLTLHCGAMAIFPTYLTTSFINKFCSPPVNRYSPFPTIEVRRNKMVQWMEIKCVTLRSARSHPRVFFFFWVFPIKTERNNTRQPPRKREGYGERPREREGERETERNSWSDEKKAAILTALP